jgi:hypothetical protein
LSARWPDLIDQTNQVGVGWGLVEIVTAFRLLVAGAADAAEARNALCSFGVNGLILGVPSYPRDDYVVLLAEDEVHAPVSIEAPLAYPVVGTNIGAHANAAGLASTMAKLIDHVIELLLGLAPKRFDPWLTAAREADVEPRCHERVCDV